MTTVATLLMMPVTPDEARCKVHLIHGDKRESRCVLAKTHQENDSDHLDVHGCRAKVLVSQATIREVAALAEADRIEQEKKDERRLRRSKEIRDAESAISDLLEQPGVSRDRVVKLLREMADAIENDEL